jgi:Flp pilus assembly pilin Flp
VRPPAIIASGAPASADEVRRSREGSGPNPHGADGGPLARLRDETGASTAEYAITVLAACGFAAVLVVLLASDEVRGLLMGIITDALSKGS